MKVSNFVPLGHAITCGEMMYFAKVDVTYGFLRWKKPEYGCLIYRPAVEDEWHFTNTGDMCKDALDLEIAARVMPEAYGTKLKLNFKMY